MWIWILIISIILAFIIGAIKNNENDTISIIVMTLVILGICFIFSTVNRVVIKEYEEEQYKIQGLENNISTKQETNGAFVLGFGYVNSSESEEMKYYYFKVNDLGKKLENIKIDNYSNTYIRETDDKEPCLIYKYQETKNQEFWKWLFGDDIEKNKIAKILVVPTNTIKIEYDVNIGK